MCFKYLNEQPPALSNPKEKTIIEQPKAKQEEQQPTNLQVVDKPIIKPVGKPRSRYSHIFFNLILLSK